MRVAVLLLLCFISAAPFTEMTPSAQTQSTPKPPDAVYLLKPAHVFDGESAQLRDGWVVLVRGEKIEAVGTAREALSLRVARATNHLRSTLMAGFTTLRDLGTEGAGYADVGLKQAVQQGIIPGPRLYVATRAIEIGRAHV